MKARRITFVASGLGTGGAELQLAQLALGFRAAGWSVSVVSMQPGGYYRDCLVRRGINVSESLVERSVRPASLVWLTRAIGGANPDLVVTWAPRANLWGRLAAIGMNLPVIASVRATYSYLPRTYYPIERLLAIRTARIVTPSRATTDFLVRAIGIPTAKTQTIYSGVDTRMFSPERDGAAFRRRWGLRSSLVLLTPARFVPQKNHALLLTAFSDLAPDFPDAVLVLAGTGPLEHQAREQAAALGDQVRFIGELVHPKVAEAVAAADMLCLLSNFEGMPNVVLEAMAGARPVVATAVDGTRELIEDRINGLLVRPGDALGARQAMSSLASSATWRAELGAAARRKVEAEYSVQQMVTRYLALADETLRRLDRL